MGVGGGVCINNPHVDNAVRHVFTQVPDKEVALML